LPFLLTAHSKVTALLGTEKNGMRFPSEIDAGIPNPEKKVFRSRHDQPPG
jgi:hypothetical protein